MALSYGWAVSQVAQHLLIKLQKYSDSFQSILHKKIKTTIKSDFNMQNAFNSNKGFHLSFNKEEKNKSRRRRQININNICVIKTQPLTYRLFSSIAATESVLRCHIAMVTREVRGWSPDWRGSTRWCLGPRCGGQSWEMAQFPTPAALAGRPRCQIQTFGQVYTEPAAFLHQSESSTVSWHDNRQVDGAATYWRHDSPVPLSSLPLGASSDSS